MADLLPLQGSGSQIFAGWGIPMNKIEGNFLHLKV